MNNSISYRITLNLNDSINTEIISALKKLLVEEFENIETRENTIILTNNDSETVILASDLMIINFSDFEFGQVLPGYLYTINSFLRSKDIYQILNAKIVYICNITNVESNNFLSLGFGGSSLNKILDIDELFEKEVNSVGLKFSLEDYQWHYEIELLPDRDTEYLIKMDCFYDIEDYEDENDAFYLEFENLQNEIENHKTFLINKFSKHFINFS
jgi:hypothetical protein